MSVVLFGRNVSRMMCPMMVPGKHEKDVVDPGSLTKAEDRSNQKTDPCCL
jgi:hypothetical protein